MNVRPALCGTSIRILKTIQCKLKSFFLSTEKALEFPRFFILITQAKVRILDPWDG